MFIYDDNFLTEKEIVEIEEMFWSKDINWVFHKQTQDNNLSHAGVVNTKIKDVPYFTAMPNNEQQNDLTNNIIKRFCDKHNIQYKNLSRVKFNIQPSTKEGTTLYPHIDTADPHLVFLYYVCDSDGDTILYDQTFTGEVLQQPLSIMQSITPKRGAAFVVDGKHFHSITPPKETMLRAVINANLGQ
jgi:hypothetical protein